MIPLELSLFLNLHVSDVGGSGSSYEQRHVTIKNHLLKLIENEFIQRCPSPQDSSKPVPVLSIGQEELYR